MGKKTLWRVLLIAVFLIGLPCVSHSASITVDGNDPVTNCTLAEAITSANNDSAAGNGCADGSGADIITLETDVSLNTALPEINSEVIIEGNSHKIDGQEYSAVGSVLRISTVGSLTLRNAVVTGGNAAKQGGGIDNYGMATLNKVTVSGNTASSVTTDPAFGGGINNQGTLTLISSTVSGNRVYSLNPNSSHGGGICNATNGMPPAMSGGALTLTNSTVSGNTAAYGGGIYNYATVTMNSSALNGNTASSIGGGMYNGGTAMLDSSTVSGNNASNGGGLFNGGGTATLTNTTVSGNAASESGGGLGNSDGTLTLIGSTVSGNSAVYYGAGIKSENGWIKDNIITLRGSLVSGNTGAGGNEICLYNLAHTTISTDSFNLFGHSGETSAQAFTAACEGFTPSASDRTAFSDGTHPTALSSIINITLADNGGPTKTHALPAGSPAIDLDADCAAGLTKDQRGESRPSGSGCDGGAFEVKGSAPSTGGKALPAVYKLLLN